MVTTVDMCGTNISVGDYVYVEYTNGTGMFKGARVKGVVTKVWDELDGNKTFRQAQVNNAWCFHSKDRVLEHKKEEVGLVGNQNIRQS